MAAGCSGPRLLCFYFQLIAFSHGLLYQITLPVVCTHTAGRREEGVWTEPNESLIGSASALQLSIA